MKKTVFGLIAGVLLASGPFLQTAEAEGDGASAEAEISVSARVILPLEMSSVDDLKFGLLPQGDSYFMDPENDSVIATSGEVVFGELPRQRGEISVQGEEAEAILYSFEETIPLNHSGEGSPLSMTMMLFDSATGLTTESPVVSFVGVGGSGSTIYVGGTLEIGAEIPVGTYSGTFTLGAEYE